MIAVSIAYLGDAYGHLRYYVELAPTNAWAWCWLGQACEQYGAENVAWVVGAIGYI